MPVAQQDQIRSIRELGRVLGRSHTTVGEWVRHPEWEFPSAPPWPRAMADEMDLWARATLRENRDEDRRPKKPAAAPASDRERAAVILGELHLTVGLLLDEAGPMWQRCRDWFGKLWGEQTVEDLGSLVSHMNFGTMELLMDEAEREGGHLMKEGTPAYYRRLREKVLANPDAIAEQWNCATFTWLASRYAGDTRKWWRLLPNPPADRRMSKEFLSEFKPLAHRTPGATAAAAESETPTPA